ncbi:pyruvoyl-dependent arginine decarboxylase [Nocardia brasiliensis]|uniref:pyruvoyl-dependent arginine decarboxylase n=1 Tax=Nocardia brasiliensis TaxID=37326 RepID=UPI000DFE7A52|nr:pyruvoyl-dependent arginine decarboxylase [Nocardia brasiliensis]SUB53004.1 pyruvoyl-dependent arginine decarboxylase [Nocardia brasiliensis]
MIHTTPRSGPVGRRGRLVGLPWIDRLRPPLGRPVAGAPLTIEIGAATGAGPTAMSAFDAALRELGVGDANLIRLSSVIPPGAALARTGRVRKPIPWGDRLYCVYAVQHAHEPGATAAAGIGWVLRDDGSGAGLFVEHEAETTAEVTALIRSSLDDMTRHRPETFGPIQLCTTETTADGGPTCALVLAAYHTTPWGFQR